MEMLDRLKRALFRPVDPSSLVVYRIAFGAIMVWEVFRYFQYGWIARYWIEPVVNFKYYGFGWVHPWPGNGMYYHMVVIAVLSAMILVGLFYRAAAVLFFLAFTYTFLLEQARYLNHFYLVMLLGLIMIFMPAHRAFSLDAIRKPSIASSAIPVWPVWLLRAQLGIVYFYGGIAKINPDWMRGRPIHDWVIERTEALTIAPFFEQEWVGYSFAYGGLLLDLLVVPFLVWRKTRMAAFLVTTMFHLMNAWLFSIGIFPWFMIAATTIYFSPAWPRRMARRWLKFLEVPRLSERQLRHPASPFLQNVTVMLLAVYLAVQMLVPLRHHLYPGNVSWTEEGHMFSWHMKLRDKSSRATFFVIDRKTGREHEIYPSQYLSGWQRRKMNGRPDMIIQFAHFLAEEARLRRLEDVEVRATVWSSLNGRRSQLLVDPAVDLTSIERNLWPAGWILPLTEELQRVVAGRRGAQDDLD